MRKKIVLSKILRSNIKRMRGYTELGGGRSARTKAKAKENVLHRFLLASIRNYTEFARVEDYDKNSHN